MTAAITERGELVDTPLPPARVASADVGEVLAWLATSADGLSSAEAPARRARFGPNSVRTHRVSAIAVLGRQLRNAVLWLLAGTAAVSFFLGDSTEALIIAVILAASIGLGFVNEYRAERMAAALHSRVRHTAAVRRDGHFTKLDVNELVPGDVIRLTLGELVPADVRLIEATGLECNESILSGESIAREKSPSPVASAEGLTDLADLAFMGTIVSAGEGTAVVYATGVNAQFGRLAAGLGQRQPETDFQTGLRQFSYLLLQVAVALTVLILVTNLLLRRPIIESVLFSLAIAVGITPQLLPAVVSTSLATGSRRLARYKVLVKRLVCIEDLGDVDVLMTDKTGTLTEGRITLIDAVDADGAHDDSVLRIGLLATDVDRESGGASADPLDAALWESPASQRAAAGTTRRLAVRPFDHIRRSMSALVDDGDRRLLIVKGAPEQVLAQCVDVPAGAQNTLAALFADGRRVVAVAGKTASELTEITSEDECGLALRGFLVFADEPKATARDSLTQLAGLGVEVKIATGDNPQVAEKVCAEIGLASKGTITGVEMEGFDDDGFVRAARQNTIFARITPEQKGRLVSAARRSGRSVGFLGDGVNDALALHSADVGISVDTATDVAKDAADVVLLEKDLGVLATGIAEGRRIFANTIKYVLMGTSSNFGNMFSAAAASAVLPFLPMLPSQILLNNLLYDTSQLGHSQRPCRRGAAARPVALEHRVHPAVHVDFRSHQLAVRLHDVRLAVGRVARGRRRVPHRVVLGVAGHADADHLRDPHPQSAVPEKQARSVVDHQHVDGHRGRGAPDRVAVGTQSRVHAAAMAILRRARRDDHRLSGVGRDHQDAVLRRTDAVGRATSSHPRRAASDPPPGRAVQPRRSHPVPGTAGVGA